MRLYISCRRLKDLDTFSPSDPYVHVYMRNTYEGEWIHLGLTEIVWDNLNPDFITTFTLDYHFEEQTYLFFKVYDSDDPVP